MGVVTECGIVVGDWVVAGEGEGLDVGRIGELKADDVALVWWESGVATPCDLSADDVSVYGTREAAIEAFEAR